ncbi:hypothetical protein DE146DRAFT_628749 [Phaeosphaeria sp. MPI-PUGE-AT-0046c]|nr:hypothetical protein DE146DRAFT_628749 [Phaeosphaeria sp. MPI-PUGE-AT-0046c]
MEIVGTAAAAITFGALILKLSQKLCKSAKKIKYARREITKLVKEMGIFADLYEDFYRNCVSSQRKKGRDTFSTGRLIDWIEDATGAFMNLLTQVEALAGDSRLSVLESLTAHVKWLFSEHEVKCLRYSLRVAQENMRGFSNLRVIEAINDEIQLIKNVIAQGNGQAIRELQDRFGVTLGEKLRELKQMRRHRHKQDHAINSRMVKAARELEQQSMRVGTSSIVPKQKKLFAFAEVVDKYAVTVQEQRQFDPIATVSSRSQPTRASSYQTTDSAASHSFVPESSIYSEAVAVASSVTSTEELDKTSNCCGKCTGGCGCPNVEPHPGIPTRPSSPESTPLPRPTIFAHPSHRFDRNWQQSTSKIIAYPSIEDTRPASEHETCSRNDLEPESIEEPSHEEYESDDAEEVGEAADEEAQMSPFRPIAGVQGKYPRNWKTRHDGSESADDHWHKRL